MKTVWKRIIGLISSVMLFFGAGSGTASAQWEVTDLGALTANAIQYVKQGLQWIEENQNAFEDLFNLEQQTEWLDKVFGEKAQENIMSYIRDAEEMTYLVQSVNYSAQAYGDYIRFIGNNLDYLDPSVTASLMRRTAYLFDNTTRCYERATKILADRGLTYGEKKKALEGVAAEAVAATNQLVNETASTISNIEGTRSITGSMLLLSDAASDENIRKAMSFYGTYGTSPRSSDYESFFGGGSPELQPVEEGTLSLDDVLDNGDSVRLKSGYKNVFYVISILLALLMAGMTIIVLIKWNRDSDAMTPGQEFYTWFRIPVAIIVVSFILSIISAYVGTRL